MLGMSEASTATSRPLDTLKYSKGGGMEGGGGGGEGEKKTGKITRSSNEKLLNCTMLKHATNVACTAPKKQPGAADRLINASFSLLL